MRLGVHVPIAGGLLEAVERAKRLSCTTMQIFSRSPRGGRPPALDAGLAERFDAARRTAGLEPLAVHGPYIINLASPEPAMWRRSAELYREEYQRASTLKAQYLVTHVGSHRGQGEAEGLSRVAEAISQAMAGIASDTMVLLENTAGSGQGLGYRFEQLRVIRDAVSAPRRVGICLDTAHLFAAGYPIHTPDGLERTVEEFDRAVGLEHLHLIHLNDSKAAFDSRVDRHWHIGQGHIGADAFQRLVTHAGLKNVPFILETPKSGEEDDLRNLATVRKLAGLGGSAGRRRGRAAAAGTSKR